MSDGLETYSPVLNRDLEDLVVSDLGDLVLSGLSIEQALDAIADGMAYAAEHARLAVMLGGEHTASLGGFRGLKRVWPEAVILQAVYREPPRLAEQCHAIGYNPLFIGVSAIVLDKTIELGGKHVEGVMGVEVYPLPTDPGSFLDLYRADMKKYFPNLALDTTNLYGYQKAALFVEGMQRAGRNLTRDSLLKAIESIKDWDPGWGLKYSYGGDNRRVMSRAARLVSVKDGKWTKASEWMELQETGRK